MNRIIDTNLRVSLTLSQNAYDIIMSDLNRFDYPKINYRVNFSGFLNQIFTNHHQSSKKFSILRESLFELISKNNTLTIFQKAKVKKDIYDYFLLHGYSDVNHNNNKKSFKFLLNKKNIQIINHKKY